MYNVSNEYKSYIKSAMRRSTITGTLTTTTGESYPLNDSTFIKNSLYVENQCINNDALTLGVVYAGECGFIINSNIDRYSLFGAEVVLSYTLFFQNGAEQIPLGKWNVDNADRIGSKIKITAVDGMSKLDKKIDNSINGSWYDLLKFCADVCGLELAQTKEELEALHINTTYQSYTLQADKIETYRDAVSFLCRIICAFATIDRVGKLKIVQYGLNSVDSNNSPTRLNNCKFSDYTTRYNSITARFFKDENYYPYVSSDSEINGLMLDIGDIPIVGGTPETKQQVLDNILATLEQIIYVPSTLYISSNPAYDLGDLIECDNVNNTESNVNTYVMKYKFNYRGKETINCSGENPLLQNVKSKNDKKLSAMKTQISDKSVMTVSYENADPYTIHQEFTEIAALYYAISSYCRPIILASIPFTLDLDGYVEFKLYDGLAPMENGTYKSYYSAGSHWANIFYLDNCSSGDRRKVRVVAKTYVNPNSVERQNTADNETFSNAFVALKAVTSISDINNLSYEVVNPDTTEPTMTIAAMGIKFIAYTQGIASSYEWDGTLEFTEEINDFNIANTIIDSFVDQVESSQLTPDSGICTDSMSDIQIDGITLDEFSATCTNDLELDYASDYNWQEFSTNTWNTAMLFRWKRSE